MIYVVQILYVTYSLGDHVIIHDTQSFKLQLISTSVNSADVDQLSD